ncbi:serine/threonine-protein kinase [[Actinomadura] parvosata]|uniref:serine/threonine-protein kinase n=1 Tax=[Actinomadura] parvosata TaxID=1955412 RepID=UPI0009AE55D9|nr:serine/threonine-protein kinase [Nonomuraea sp. ATCC 55076]
MSELRADDPRQLGAYRLTRRLGQGGQGVVYLGASPQGAPVAVKLLHASLSADQDARRRFLGEVEAVRKVAAFCTAQLLDADLEGDRPYLVSEYVDGPSLRELVVEEGPRRGGSLERLAIGTATALGAIHRAGVVHRDFKPGNVLLGIDGPRVIDFGVSRLMDAAVTTTHLPVGTPAYMAPERMKGESAGPAADMWAWGLTVAYTATGRHAYTAGTHQEVLARVLYGKPDLGALGGRLREIVEACLAAEPGERPDAEEVLRLLLGQEAAGVGDVLPTAAMLAVGGTGREPDAGDGREREAGDGPEREAGDGPEREVGDGRERDARSGRGREAGSGRERAGGTGRAGSARLSAVVGLGAAEAAPGVITDPDPTTSFPAITAPLIAARAKAKARDRPAPGRRRIRPWQAAVVALGVAAAAGGLLLWTRGAAEGLAGTWTGSAEHFSAGRVFPVELRLTGDDGGAMRWGADLHCSGRLARTGSGPVFLLDQVRGEECYPGTLRMSPTSDANQMAIKVTRDGKDEVTYSGKVARTS